MLSYIIKRLLMLIPILWGVSLIVFLIVHLMPGDPAEMVLRKYPDQAKIEEIRKLYGWNKPLTEQYLAYMKRTFLEFDLGKSHVTRRKIADDLKEKFPATVELAVMSMLFAIFFGVIIGVISSVKRYSLIDHAGMILALIGISLPIFWLALILMNLFAVNLSIFPVGDRIDIKYDLETITNFYLLDSLLRGNLKLFFSSLHHILLPALALSTIPMAIIVRVTRSSMLEVLGKDYIKTARAKGLSEKIVIMKHGLKNAFIPILTIVGTQFGYLLGGAVLTETIFNWPGLGRYVVKAVLMKDFKAIQGGILLMATSFVIVNLLVDISYAWLDPRVRYEREKS